MAGIQIFRPSFESQHTQTRKRRRIKLYKVQMREKAEEVRRVENEEEGSVWGVAEAHDVNPKKNKQIKGAGVWRLQLEFNPWA